MKKVSKRKRIAKKLIHKYRLVVLNEDTLEERISFKLTRLNVFVVGSLFTITLVTGTILLITLTTLKEYIPGYPSTDLRRKATNLIHTTDSLKQALAINNRYISSIKKVLLGELKSNEFDKDSLLALQQPEINTKDIDLNPSKEDSLFREEVEMEDRYNLFRTKTQKSSFVFFAPVTGNITQNYNLQEKHFAVDIAAKKGTPVKAVADGTVIFAEWTAETGYVIIVEHGKDNMLSVYKHNATILKEQGDFVKSGEVIASVGSTGELTTGPHLHFELWSNGYPVNPVNFIDFE